MCLSISSSFASSVSIPDFKVKLETVSPDIDISNVTLIVTELCEKISMTTTYTSGAKVFEKRYEIKGNSNGEYEFPAKKLKCSALAGVRLYYSIYSSTGQFIHREEVQGYGNVSVSAEELNKRFENPIIIK